MRHLFYYAPEEARRHQRTTLPLTNIGVILLYIHIQNAAAATAAAMVTTCSEPYSGTVPCRVLSAAAADARVATVQVTEEGYGEKLIRRK